MRGLVTCIVPVFNGQQYLAEAIQSILNQSYSPTEIIVVDDGSTDGTRESVEIFGKQIRYLDQPHSGAPSARNLGLHVAKGEFVAFLDADDYWLPEKLERQMALLATQPDLGYCVTYIQNFWMPEKEQEKKHFADHRISRPLPGYVTQTLLARRGTFDIVGEFNTALHHGDAAEWFLRARECEVKMSILPDVLTRRRMHSKNLSRSIASSREDFLKILKGSLDRQRGRKS